MNKNELPEKMCHSPVKKGRVKSIFSFSPLFLLEKHITLLSSSPQPISWSLREHSDFSPCPRSPKLSCFPRAMHSIPQPSQNDTQPLSLNLEGKPVHTPPVFKEIPEEILLDSGALWSFWAVKLHLELQRVFKVPSHPNHSVFLLVCKGGWPLSPVEFFVSLAL